MAAIERVVLARADILARSPVISAPRRSAAGVPVPGGSPFSVTGTLTESLPATHWIVRAYRRDTGEMVGAQAFTGTIWDCPTNGYEHPVDCVIVADIGEPWRPSTRYAAGDYVYQTNLSVNLYFFKCVSAGVSGGSEPTWPTSSGATVTDGAVTWECMGPVPRQWIDGPFLPG
jgi:hypothetical protein